MPTETSENEPLAEEQLPVEERLRFYKERYSQAQHEIEQLQTRLDAQKRLYDDMLASTSWKLTAPMRALMDGLIDLARMPFFRTAKFFLRSTLAHGLPYAIKLLHSLSKELKENQRGQYSRRALEAQREAAFPQDIRFSILVPLYNTPENYLKEMIASVQAQTYPNWDLCLADGSDEAHARVGEICKALAQQDSRIRYRKLTENRGISENTNACLAMATGDYIGLLDHDDYLCPAALFEVMKAICEKGADFIYTDEAKFSTNVRKVFEPNFKPDFAPDSLRAINYICHFTVFAKALSDAVGGFRSECDGAQDYDLTLRLTEQAGTIVHIPKVLYLWRVHGGSTSADIGAKEYVTAGGRHAVETHLERIGLKGEVSDAAVPSAYRIRYALTAEPLISILIPSYEHVDDLKKCLDSIYLKSTYPNFEIIVIENNSVSESTFAFYRQIQAEHGNLRVVEWKKPFNYSAINNFGARYAKGEYLLLLNNDIAVISPDWMQEMLMFAQRPDVGAVGAKLYYPDDTVQHAGVGLGLGGIAGHYHKDAKRQDTGYMSRLVCTQDVSAVTAACMLLPRRVWDEMHGLDEGYQVAFNDVDLCMRIRRSGYLVVWTPYAELYHYESKSRGYEDTPEKQLRFAGEINRFRQEWAAELAAGDPYYNPNLTLRFNDFRLRQPGEYIENE